MERGREFRLNTRTVAFMVTLVCCSLFAQTIGEAQVRSKLPPYLRDDPYLVELDKILEEWNAAKLSLPKKSALAAKFEKRLEETVGRGRYPYQTADWAEQMRKRFAGLREELKPERKINDQASLVLALLFNKGLADLKKQVPTANVREELHLPVFLIFSSAQEAVIATRREIDLDAIIASLFGWWTTTWPFCDRTVFGRKDDDPWRNVRRSKNTRNGSGVWRRRSESDRGSKESTIGATG